MRTGIGRTNIGKARKMNQDAIFLKDEKVGALDNVYVIADGMGGHNAGEVASVTSVEAFYEHLSSAKVQEADGWQKDLLAGGVAAANTEVYTLQAGSVAWRGMGTTFSACTLYGNKMYIAHVGDSRIYIFKDGILTQVSNDHSLVGELLRLGRLTAEEARKHPNKNVLTRSLGTDATLQVDTDCIQVTDDTVILLCSDGLYDMVTDSDIQKVLNMNIGAEAKADALVELANDNGGRDNISLIIITENKQ